MPLKHKLYFSLATLHLVLIGLFASHLGEWGRAEHPVMKAVSCLGDYTGSNNIFSFFAPGLSDQPYVVYATKDATGKERVLDLKGNSPDFTNRINNIYGYLTLEEGRSVFSASLAQFVLQRYPSADKIRVAMVVQKIPTMDEFRDGKRSQWHFWFHRDFEKNTAADKSKIN
ncbi:MAG: hypothetical protein ABI416_14590 [Ginsengibacter sp.]